MRLLLPYFAAIWPLICVASPMSDRRAVQTTPTATLRVTTTDSTQANIPMITLNSFATTQTIIAEGVPIGGVTIASVTTITSSPKSSWQAPSVFQDLDAFNITDFPFGQQNLAIVTSVPATASASPDCCHSQEEGTDKEEIGSMLQILYPAHSINPRNNLIGGAEFYSVPLDISAAVSVTLLYSVFFPVDFDFILGGKLPGLYGGGIGCSGGNLATRCFSTRLMWRNGGLGELYLYAPKDRQTNALCTDPQSVCDSTYGISIGRGSFNWTAGCWTTVNQTVSLNTPGSQDGGFVLDVNGARVIDRRDIFYRDIPQPENFVGEEIEEHHRCLPCMEGDSAYFAHRILWRIAHGFFAFVRWNDGVQESPECPCSPDAATLVITKTIGPVLVLPHDTTGGPVTVVSPSPAPNEDRKTNPPVGFIGLFFSTFFGGHEDRYATPRDQYAWFKDFKLTYNL